MEYTLNLTEIANDVIKGLSAKPKYLLSKYFYDTAGSIIFQKIMRMPEYYLTNSELEVFQIHKQQIVDSFIEDGNNFDLIELGAGDGLKTKILLSHLLHTQAKVKYIPIDISEEAVLKLLSGLKIQLPELNVEGKIGDYFKMMEKLNKYDHNPKVLLFLGSNIGNFNFRESINFLSQLSGIMTYSDKLLVGFDMKKDPEIIRNAYNDPHGHTRDFNLNLLRRINKELNANFNESGFLHAPTYDSSTGEAKSYLLSKENQRVFIQAADQEFFFKKGEAIYVEMSQKYDLDMIGEIARQSKLIVKKHFFDRKQYFVNVLFEKAPK